LDEMLNGLDWTAWMAEYDGRKGQPPIPPRIMAGVILYGLIRSIRSRRMLEYLCGHNVDFVWLAATNAASGMIVDCDVIAAPNEQTEKKLAKSCFVYDEKSDTYYCPMDRLWITRRRRRSSGAG